MEEQIKKMKRVQLKLKAVQNGVKLSNMRTSTVDNEILVYNVFMN